MPGWRTWTTEAVLGVAAAAYCWYFWAEDQPPADRLLCFAILFTLVIFARILYHFPGPRFLPAQIAIVFLFLLSLLHFETPHWGILKNAGATALALYLMPPFPRREIRFSKWWPATKRTFRRLHGNWREDDERFVQKMSSGSKKV